MAGTYPAWSVEWAPGISASAFPTAPDWVDVSSYVGSWNVKWGRENEFDQPGAGTADLVLDNSDGTWDPDNTSGTYYGDLKAGAWFRIKAGTTTANTDVFYGHVSIAGFSIDVSQFADSYVSVRLVDDLEWLSNVDLPSSLWTYTVTATNTPGGWYRFGETRGTTMGDWSGRNRPGTYEGGATFNARTGLVANDSNGAIEFDGSSQYATIRPYKAPTASGGSVAFWIAMPAVGADPQPIVHASGGALTYGWFGVQGTAAGGEAGKIHYDGGATFGSTVRVDDGQVHFVVIDAQNDDVYVDGVDVTTTTTGQYANVGIPEGAIIARDGAGRMFTGTLDDVVYYPSDDNPTWSTAVDDYYAAGTAPWAHDNTGARVGKLLDLINFHA